MDLFEQAEEREREARRRAARRRPEGTGGGEPAGPPAVSVGDLTEELKRRLAGMGRLSVEGEVSGGKRAASGHVYFDLKDARARISCAIWRSQVERALRFRLEEGMQVVCHGRLDVYAPRGSYSLIVERVERRGLGELLARLERLKAELRERGWFERTRPLPPMPRRVGVVTSRDADGWQDFLRTRSLRWPLYPVRLRHTRVQGPGAAEEIARAIADLDASGVDVICVVRGGGSLEDLWAFNELPVAEAVWNASVPVVSGVGHQTDVTLIDLVADHRAHTPTDAAQTVLPDRRALEERLDRWSGHLLDAIDRQLDRRARALDELARRRVLRGTGWLVEDRARAVEALGRRLGLVGRQTLEGAAARLQQRAARLARRSPAAMLAERAERLGTLAPRLERHLARHLEGRERRLDVAAKSLQTTSPLAVLERGYSITRREDGRAVRGPADVAPGERVETLLLEGLLRATVDEVDGDAGPTGRAARTPDDGAPEGRDMDAGEPDGASAG